MPLIYSSDSDEHHQPHHQPSRSSSSHHQPMRLFGLQQSMHSLFGGRRVADVLLWRDRKLSAKILAGFTITWFLFEVVEFQFVTLASYIIMAIMFALFLWNYGSNFIQRRPPSPHEIQISETTVRYITGKMNKLLMQMYHISSGQDLPYFIMTMASLWVLSVIGSYTSTLNLAYISYLCLTTIPILYERYEKEVEYLATQGNRDMRKLYEKVDSKFLSKIPRGPVKKAKFK
ncbi:hypothetical protein V2J09_015046 [Rumex salicifolius]